MRRCQYVDRIIIEDGKLKRIVTAVCNTKTFHKAFDVFKQDETGKCEGRNIYYNTYCGYMVAFPGDKNNSYYFGRVGDLYETEPWGDTKKLPFHSCLLDSQEKDLIIGVYPEFKYTLEKAGSLTKEETIEALVIWKDHKEVELLLAAGLKNLVYNRLFFKLTPEKTKQVITWCAKHKDVAKNYSLKEILFIIANDLTLEEFKSFKEFKSHCYTGSLSYKDYLYLKNLTGSAMNNLRFYRDYKLLCRQAGHNFKDKYWREPKDLLQAHAKVLAEVDKIKKTEEQIRLDKQQELYFKAVKKFQQSAKEIDGYTIYVPDSLSDWSLQAETLHQCILRCGYQDRVINKKELLVFIRKGRKPIATAQIFLKSLQLGQFYSDERAKNIYPSKKVRDVFNLWFAEFCLVQKRSGKSVKKRTELNLSEIVKEFKQIECDDEEEYSYTVTIKKEYDGSFETVYVSFCDESNGKTALELRLMKYEDNPYRLYCAYYDDFKLTDEINILKDFNKLEAMLIQAILNETTFVLDKNERWCENELCHYSD